MSTVEPLMREEAMERCLSEHALQRDEGYHLGLVEEKEDGSKGISAKMGIPIIVVACSACGHIQLFAAGIGEPPA